MAQSGLKVNVRVQNLNEVLRAFDQLPRDANDVLRERTRELAETLADRVRAAGTSDTPQSAAAARTVRARGGNAPGVEAGPEVRLFGSEFGATRKFGWYRRGRYYHSAGRQYRPHLGSGSYWFFRTVDANQSEIDQEWQDAATEIIRRWGS